MEQKLIVDVGMYRGEDTEFYLKKGFRVVAIEANPHLVREVENRLAHYIQTGQLIIHNVAINRYDGEVDFFVNNYADLSTIMPDEVEDVNKRFRNSGMSWQKITVPCLRIDNLLAAYGTPHYIKIDVEGADIMCLERLIYVTSKPSLISVELSSSSHETGLSELAWLRVLGYHSYKIVNQAVLADEMKSMGSSKSNPKNTALTLGHSGAYGDEAPGEWIFYESALKQVTTIYNRQHWFGQKGRLYRTPFKRVIRKFKRYTHWGWFDIHAKLNV